jgi:hypothetical protein
VAHVKKSVFAFVILANAYVLGYGVLRASEVFVIEGPRRVMPAAREPMKGMNFCDFVLSAGTSRDPCFWVPARVELSKDQTSLLVIAAEELYRPLLKLETELRSSAAQ